MKKLMIVIAALALSACAGTPQQQIDVQATIAKVCPPVNSAIVLLKVSPAIQPKTLETLAAAEPYIVAACTAEIPAGAADLYALADKALPLIVAAVAESSLPADQKEIAIIGLTVAQVALAAAR